MNFSILFVRLVASRGATPLQWPMTWALLLAFFVASPTKSFADLPGTANELSCSPETTRTLSPSRLLRAISLDLRGVPPTFEEYEELRTGASLETFVDRFLGEEAFADRVVRFHRSLLWNNVSNVQIINLSRRLALTGDLWEAAQRRQGYRGNPVSCDNVPATFLNGRLQYRERLAENGIVERIEGYVEVNPWWAPHTRVKVCGFDAQENAIAASGNSCTGPHGLSDIGCGCGPNLERCSPPIVQVWAQEAMGRDVDLRVKAMIVGNESYLSLFESRRAFVNGPLVQVLRHQGTSSGGGVSLLQPLPYSELPSNLDSGDPAVFAEVELPAEHAGVLTSPAFLLRFQTRRARAARFYDAFLCKPLQPPPGGIPSGSDEDAKIADLQIRPGCAGCHTFLEPTGGYWGRWSEYGIVHLDSRSYPTERADCSRCARGGGCSTDCSRNYLTTALSPDEEPFLGQFRPLVFARATDRDHGDLGVRALVQRSVSDGSLPACSVKRAYEWLLGRSAMSEEQESLDHLSRDFAQSQFNYREMVRAIVLSDAYRTVQ